MKQVAITGAAGFIGSALAWQLNRQGQYRVLAVDALGHDERWQNLAGLEIADYWDKAVFLRSIEADSALPELSAIIHMGACSATDEADADFLMRNNFAYTRALAQWCLRHGVRFIYASSAATYGSGEQGYSDDPALLPRLRPQNKYAYSKHAFDLWALRHGALDSITGLKYFNVFGPNEYHKAGMRSMVLQAFEQIQAGGMVRLFASDKPEYRDGEQERDFIYVHDAAAMTLWFLDHPAGGIYNVGTGRARTWNDLAKGVFTALDRPPRIEYVPVPERIRAAYQYTTRADLTRLRRVGCTVEARPLQDAILDYVQNYLSGPSRFLR